MKGRRQRLSKTKQSKNKKRIYGFDIETCNDNKDFVCASVYLNDEQIWFFKEKQKLIDFFKTKQFHNSIVVATNLSFDFFGTFHNTDEIMFFDTLFRGSDLLYAKTHIHHKDFSRKRKTNKGRQGESLWFLDTLNYCKMSVAKIGGIINVPKIETPSFIGKMPQNETEWEIMKEYNIQDSKVSKMFMQFLFDTFEHLGATPKTTIASTAMSLFKNKYLDDTYFTQTKEHIIEIFEAYYGGRTEAIGRGTIENHKYYDFNSLYPSVMMKSFPDPNSHRITHKNTNHYINKFDGCSKVRMFCPEMKYPLLPMRINNKLIFGTGEISGWYNHVEIRKAVSIGYVLLNVEKTHYYSRMCDPFKGYVTDLYEKRQKYKEEGSPMEKVVKLLLNSLYGKFGQKFMDKDNWVPMTLTMEELDKLKEFEIIENFIRIKNQCEEPSAFCTPIWASYVTSYARIKLYDAMVDSNAVYCDTDSIVTTKEMCTSDKLGDLKLEMGDVCGIVVKPKMYAFVGNDDGKKLEYVKMKGVCQRMCFDDFKKFLDDPTTTYMKFMKFKESLRRGFIPNEIVMMTKTLDLNDTKREWIGNFNQGFEWSTPYRVKEGMLEHEWQKIYDENYRLQNIVPVVVIEQQ